MPTEPGNKYSRLAADLEEHIRSGRWETGKVPSVRDIAESYRVSVVTVSRALQILRDKGLVLTVERSGCYVVPQTPQPVRTWALCISTPTRAARDAARASTQTSLETISRGGSDAFDANVLDINAGSEALRKQARVAFQTGVKGAFLIPSGLPGESAARELRLLSTCEEAGLAVVILERNVGGPSLLRDLVGTDDLDGGRQVAQHLYATGRTRVAFAAPAAPGASHADRLAGYLHAAYLAGREPLVVEIPTDGDGRGAFGTVCDRLLAERADAAIGFCDTAAFGLMLELLRRGLSVPGHVAVAGFDDQPIGTTFTLGLTTYAQPADAIAGQAVDAMLWRLANPTAPYRKLTIPGRLAVRDSSRPPTVPTVRGSGS